MTRDEYERHLRRLEEQLRAGIELLQASYKHQVGAVELIWRMTNGGGAPALSLPAEQAVVASPPPPAPVRPGRRPAGDLYEEVVDAYPKLPEVFDIGDVRRALGSEPHRGSLYRILQQLMDEGYLRLESRGGGKTPTRYRKTGPEHAPDVE